MSHKITEAELYELFPDNEGGTVPIEYYFLKLSPWYLVLTDGMGGPDFHDMDEGGRFLESRTDCPKCGAVGAFMVSAGFDSSKNLYLIDCCCLACEIMPAIEGQHGDGGMDPQNDYSFSLPEFIVVAVQGLKG
jgi:hypothetical protein